MREETPRTGELDPVLKSIAHLTANIAHQANVANVLAQIRAACGSLDATCSTGSV
jgi:hypothetical protein